MSLTPDNAARYVRFAQIGAIVAAALASGAFIVPSGSAPTIEPEETRRRATPRPQTEEGEAKEPFDFRRIAFMQDWTTVAPALNWATPEQVGQSEPADTQDGEATDPAGDQEQTGPEVAEAGQDDPDQMLPTPPQLQGWRYLGPVLAGRASSALMDLGGMQRFVFQGQLVDGYQLAAIEPRRVVLERDGSRFEITLADETMGGGRPGAANPNRPETAQERLQRLRDLREQQERRRNEAIRNRDSSSGDQQSP